MPPRYAYWTIIAGGLPTAFRTAERDELLPTFRRIKEKHPDAELKYFARGKLWGSPEEARRAAEARRTQAAIVTRPLVNQRVGAIGGPAESIGTRDRSSRMRRRRRISRTDSDGSSGGRTTQRVSMSPSRDKPPRRWRSPERELQSSSGFLQTSSRASRASSPPFMIAHVVLFRPRVDLSARRARRWQRRSKPH